ncbi:hypothetical protein LPJ61_004736 [Coemansia biformis]|uniref:Uncharacterized protein n=1 Tax=Coemansia biformis TaxID=1286918 RepID=A0A9W8CWZ0_9FUNG|nr:hypothetical protein LPJ61_004736 [Coemansia biformis]
MVETYTYFRRTKVSRDAVVYKGALEEMPNPETGPAPTYVAEMSFRTFALHENTDSGTRILLTGHYEGILGRSAVIKGDHLLSMAKEGGLFDDGWSFTYMADSYRWRVAWFGRRWTLEDRNKNVLAKLERASFKYTKIGVLEILTEMDDDLKALVLITCEVVHRTIKSSEAAAASS